MNKRQLIARIEMLEAAVLYAGPRIQQAGPGRQEFLDKMKAAAGEDPLKLHVVEEWSARLPGAGLNPLAHAPAEHRQRHADVFGPDDA